jgi:hypothetical protein
VGIFDDIPIFMLIEVAINDNDAFLPPIDLVRIQILGLAFHFQSFSI